MEGRKRGFPIIGKKCRRFIVTGILLIVVLILMVGVSDIILAKAKFQKAQKKKVDSDEICTVDWESGIEELNPLLLDEYPEITDAVTGYYHQLQERSGFVEAYDGIQVFTKRGRYKDTYIVFVRYDMKIRDIYTEVPGMGTLYVEKDSENGCRVYTEIEDESVKEFIQMTAGQKDVQALMKETNEAYRAAVQSDALLQEALTDLKSAYEDSAGS